VQHGAPAVLLDASQQFAALVDQGHRIARQGRFRHRLAQQFLVGELGQHHAQEQVAPRQRQRQQQRRIFLEAEFAVQEDRRQLPPGLLEGGQPGRVAQVVAQLVVGRLGSVRCQPGGDHFALRTDPAQRGQLGILADQDLALELELEGAALALRQVLGDRQQLLPAVLQPLAQLQLRVLDIAHHGFALALVFLELEIDHGGRDRRQEDDHRDGGPEGGDAVLAQRRQAAPPAPPAGQQAGRCRGGVVGN